MELDTFIAAWRAWDARPGDPTRAGRFEERCQELGAELGIGATVLRRELATNLRGNSNRSEALAAVILAHRGGQKVA